MKPSASVRIAVAVKIRMTHSISGSALCVTRRILFGTHMKKLIPILVAAAALALAGFDSPGVQSQFAGHQAALAKAQGATIVFTVQAIPGLPVEHRLLMAKPGSMQWSNPAQQIASDGTTLWVVDPAKKEYVEGGLPAGELAKLAASEPIWIWSGFFGADPFKGATGFASGAKRNIKGVLCDEVTFTTAAPAPRPVTTYVDAKTGLIRGFASKVNGTEVLVMATQLELSDKPSLPAFTPPAGMAKVEKPTASALAYVDIEPILTQRCMPCHSTQMRQGRLDISTYAALMAAGRGRVVVPGNADGSTLIQYIKGIRKPQMPQGQPPMPESEIQMLMDWIAGGAKV